MSIRARIFALSAVALGAAALLPSSPSSAQPTPSFPFEATLTRGLGFRTHPSLDAPFVFAQRNYLQPSSKLKMLRATGPLWHEGTFCEAEHAGKTGFIRCDDASAMHVGAPPPAAPHPASESAAKCSEKTQKTYPDIGLKLCTDPTSCKAFCTCACQFDPHKWGDGKVKNDGSTTCPGVLESGPGMIAHGSTDLKPVALKNIRVAGGVRATQQVLDGLAKLDAYVGSAAWKDTYTVQINSCYRPHMEDTEVECGYILKAQHLQKKYEATPPATPKEREQLAWAARAADPMKLGLSYPGATPHSGGNACDIQMIDKKTGHALFDHTASNDERVRKASRALDEAVTTAGGRRLNYEAWHYEWGGRTSGYCTFPDCDRHWPPKGSP